MEIRKEQEREELHKAIWNIANDLRGSVDGWDFKQYVLGIMFYRYISENITNYINHDEHEAGNTNFDYAKLSDVEAEEAREDMVNTKGFFILPSQLFCNVRKNAKTNENLNETLEKVFKAIEDSAKGQASEHDFKGLFDDVDVNSNKLGSTVVKRNEKLVKILDDIGEMKLGDYKDNSIDAFGDAYEFLMGMYASNAGKSGGEYYTPQEVSELLTRLAVVGKTLAEYDVLRGDSTIGKDLLSGLVTNGRSEGLLEGDKFDLEDAFRSEEGAEKEINEKHNIDIPLIALALVLFVLDIIFRNFVIKRKPKKKAELSDEEVLESMRGR